MKFILPVVCSVLFIGCGNPIQTSAPATEPQPVEPKTANAPLLPEATAPAPISTPEAKATAPTPVSKPEVKVATETALPVPATVVTAAVDAKALFTQKCASCHGNKAEKSALNKSQVIANFSEQQINDALHGYQAGSYGKEMKSLMQGQVKSLSPEQISALAKHISTL
jgi:cytochrome c553